MREINKLDSSIELTGFDINTKALDYAKTMLPSMNIVNGSIYHLEDYFSENSFDAVLTAGVLIHIPCFNEPVVAYVEDIKESNGFGGNLDTTYIQNIINDIAKISSKFIFHAEHHGSEYEKLAQRHMRYIHNFRNLYENIGSIEIEDAPDAGDGFEQIIKITLPQV